MTFLVYRKIGRKAWKRATIESAFNFFNSLTLLRRQLELKLKWLDENILLSLRKLHMKGLLKLQIHFAFRKSKKNMLTKSNVYFLFDFCLILKLKKPFFLSLVGKDGDILRILL